MVHSIPNALLCLFLLLAGCPPSTPRNDGDLLLSFRHRVQDPGNALFTWTSNSSHCGWLGVTCSASGPRVESLRLTGLGLASLLPSELANLSSLQLLDLSDNSFRGPIPPLRNLSGLRYLNLSKNHLSGSIPKSLSENPRLEVIALDSNQLEGPIPDELGGLKKLRILELSVNNLSGVIPSTLGNLSALTNLSLARNNLQGPIPSQLGRLRNLTKLQLSANNLSGRIPDSVYKLPSLVFSSLTQNNLTGSLRADIGDSLPKLSVLYLGGNRFGGTIPVSVSNLTELEAFDLSENRFHGPIPLFGKMRKLVFVNLGNNSLSSNTEQNRRVFDSLTNCSQLEILQLYSNRLSGELPNSVSNLSRNLQEFCVDKNMLSGEIPDGIGELRNLISLAVEMNSFTGEFPSSVGKLRSLQKLSVQGNKFSGKIPDIFGNFSQPYTLTMGYNRFLGKIPPSIGGCKQLSILDMAANKLSGTIPKKIFELPNLHYMVLPGNLLTGSVPDGMKNLKQILVIELSDNRLSGAIPKSIGSCSSLQILLMSGNNPTGAIPGSIGQLASLESLDLSSNSLSGPIPKELEELEFLKKLNLSFNHLEGEVPKEGFFKDLNQASLQGNNLLCANDEVSLRNSGLRRCVRKRTKLSRLKFVIVGVSVAFVFVLVACIAFVLRVLRKNKVQENESPTVRGLPPMIAYHDIRKATENFRPGNLIGEGAFGSVYRATFNFENGSNLILAVKVINLQHSKACRSFNMECEALKNVRHRNLVKVVTTCSGIDHKGDEFKALVMEFMPNGNLEQWLYPMDQEQAGSSLTLLQRLNIIIDVASAMAYLHQDCNPPLVHCDLKPQNVLLSQDFTAHVGDFGLARFLSQHPPKDSSTIGLKGSIGYIAPEYGFGAKPSTSGDAYSFGILLLELFIARPPTDEMFREGFSLRLFSSAANENNVSGIVDPRLFDDPGSFTLSTTSSTSRDSSRCSAEGNADVIESYLPMKAEECVAATMRVGLSCAAESAKDRLTMREALMKLEKIRKSFLRF